MTRFYKTKHKTLSVESDHNLLILQLNLGFDSKIKTERKEMYNVRSLEGQKLFKELTTNNPKLVDYLSKCNIYSGGRKWLKELQHIIGKSFKKIRIKKSKPPLPGKSYELFTNQK